MRWLLPATLLACGGSVTVHTEGTDGAPVDLLVHDAVGAELSRASVAGTVDVEVPRGGSVSVQVVGEAGATTYTVGDVRPGDALVIDLAVAGPAAPAGEVLRLVVDTPLPERAAYAWVGLFECASARADGEAWVVALDPCPGEVTPVAIALDVSARPMAFLLAPADDVAELGGASRTLTGPWRDDWDGVQLEVVADEPVTTDLRIGGWSEFQRLPGAGLVSFLVPPDIEVDGRLTVRTTEGEDVLEFTSSAAAGDALRADTSEAPEVRSAILVAEGGGWRVVADTEARTRFVEALSQRDGATLSWQARTSEAGVLPRGMFDPEGLEFGRLEVGFADESWARLRATGLSSRAHWRRIVGAGVR